MAATAQHRNPTWGAPIKPDQRLAVATPPARRHWAQMVISASGNPTTGHNWHSGHVPEVGLRLGLVVGLLGHREGGARTGSAQEKKEKALAEHVARHPEDPHG
jgi:hypothetical protein